MADMDRDGDIMNGSIGLTSPPTYSPAYNQQSGPFAGGRSSPGIISGNRSPGLNLKNDDYVASAAKHASNRSGIVDVDDALGNDDGVVDIDEALNDDSSYQFSSTTTQDLRQSDNKILHATTQQFTNLNTGESNTNEFSTLSPASAAADNMQARSVTTRSGSYHKDKSGVSKNVRKFVYKEYHGNLG